MIYFLQASSEPVVLSFSDVFSDVIDDILPSGTGPYLFLTYVERWYADFNFISVKFPFLFLSASEILLFSSLPFMNIELISVPFLD